MGSWPFEVLFLAIFFTALLWWTELARESWSRPDRSESSVGTVGWRPPLQLIVSVIDPQENWNQNTKFQLQNPTKGPISVSNKILAF